MPDIESQKKFLEKSLDRDETVTLDEIARNLIEPNCIKVLRSKLKTMQKGVFESIETDVKQHKFETYDVVVLRDVDGHGTPNKCTWRVYLDVHTQSDKVVDAWPGDDLVKDLRTIWAREEAVTPKGIAAKIVDFYVGGGVLEGSSIVRYQKAVTAWRLVSASGNSAIVTATRNNTEESEAITFESGPDADGKPVEVIVICPSV